MKWVPRWLGEAYSKLYLNFKEETFDFPAAFELLRVKEELLRTILTRLRSAHLVSIFSRIGRKRIYRLVDPETWVTINAFGIKNLEKVDQGPYFILVCKALRSLAEKYGEHLTSVILYGSVARGLAKSTSDIDLLIVSDNFTGSVASRMNELVDLEDSYVKQEIGWLAKRGVYADVSYFPLRPEEAVFTRPLYLDLIYDAVILYDKNGLFESILNKLKAKLTLLEAKRVFIGENDWYWVLKPEVKKGEVLEV